MIDCKFCRDKRPTRRGRCLGCAMPVSLARTTPVQPGKRPCPECGARVVHWCDNYTRLQCIVCETVYEPVEKEVEL
jgi:hypothetical protein